MSKTVESATHGLRTFEGQAPWYCSQVLAGRERQFQRLLGRFGIPTYFPVTKRSINRQHLNDRDEVLWDRAYGREFPVFPGYVFVELDEYAWVRTRSIEVARKPFWLDFGSGPVEIPLELITELQRREQNGFVVLPEAREEYQEGDELEITEGLFQGQKGILASDPTRRNLTLLVAVESYALQKAMVQKSVTVPRTQIRRVSASVV